MVQLKIASLTEILKTHLNKTGHFEKCPNQQLYHGIICDVSHFLYPVKTTNRSCRDCQQAIVSYHTNKLRNDGIDGFITKDITM